MSEESVLIGTAELPGDLTVVGQCSGLVIFAHGSGSSRLSPRNRLVAGTLQRRGLATLLLDLLIEPEAADRIKVFDIELLADRLGEAIAWSRTRADLAGLRIGLFGASTGAAAALSAAARWPREVGAVVSRGGRPDLAQHALADVRAPTLLIVGSADPEVLALNRLALGALRCEKLLDIVPRATHLFEEAGALERVADTASDWFTTHLGPRPDAPR